MKSFSGKFAIVSGGGEGMGRQLVLQLAAQNCSVAFCDINPETLQETVKLAKEQSPSAKVTGYVADVSVEDDWIKFRDGALKDHGKDAIDLLFNNAGLGGAGSFVKDPREKWEKVFNIDFQGVYLGCRTFLPLLMKASEAWIINTSSINGFFARLVPGVPHTAYCAAKFAVKGFTESLITDFAVNAPHIGVSVVMPGHIGTGIARNTIKHIGADLSPAMPGEFEKDAPLTPAQAATIILDGVKAGKWRILVGKDAETIDAMVRQDPERAYTNEFFGEFVEAVAKAHAS